MTDRDRAWHQLRIDTLERMWQELRAIHYTMNISRTWQGNKTAGMNLDRREAEICHAINELR